MFSTEAQGALHLLPMQRTKVKHIIEILIHLLFWVGVYYALTSLTGTSIKVQISHRGADTQRVEVKAISNISRFMLIFLVLLFYGNIYWILKKALRYKNLLVGIVAATAWFICCFGANYIFIGSKLNNAFNLPIPPKIKLDGGRPSVIIPDKAAFFARDNWFHTQFTTLLIFLAIAMLSIAYFFLKEWARNEIARNQLQAHQLSTEVKFLKSQVNPHFLFNTLNNLFSMAQKKGNDDLADGISKLSGMMRYMIYESNADRVPLQKEIEYLQDCIALNKLRYADDEVTVKFSYPKKNADIVVAPMLFIPFVENAFKHGVTIGQTSSIGISIVIAEKNLIFTCENNDHSAIKRMEEEQGGIGLENVKRRLELVYPGKHRLFTQNNDGKYLVTLELDLS